MGGTADSWRRAAHQLIDRPLGRSGLNATRPNDPRPSIPRMPVEIDGSEVKPQAVLDLRGKLTHTVFDKEAQEGKMLRIFSEQSRAVEYLQSVNPKSDPIALDKPQPQAVTLAATADTKNGVPVGGGYIDYYQYPDWGGCSWRMNEWDPKINLRDLWACGFLFWGWISADDRASSIEATYSGDLVIFFDRPFPEAAFEDWSNAANALWIDMRTLSNPYHLWIPDLHVLGWGDRISSQQTFYFAS